MSAVLPPFSEVMEQKSRGLGLARSCKVLAIPSPGVSECKEHKELSLELGTIGKSHHDDSHLDNTNQCWSVRTCSFARDMARHASGGPW